MYAIKLALAILTLNLMSFNLLFAQNTVDVGRVSSSAPVIAGRTDGLRQVKPQAANRA